MLDIMETSMSLPAMSLDDIEKVRLFEARILEMPQTPIATRHFLHGGMYARTITIPANTVLSGALIEIPTLLIVSGRAVVYAGDGNKIEVSGHQVIPASAGRKQIFITADDTDVTMVFPTNTRTVEEAEEEFTREFDRLMSRKSNENLVIVTGENT